MSRPAKATLRANRVAAPRAPQQQNQPANRSERTPGRITAPNNKKASDTLLNFLSAAGEAYETETEEGGIDRKNLDTSFVDLGWGNRTTPPLSLALQR